MKPARSLGGLSLLQVETVLDVVSDAVLTVDRDYRITSFNRAAEHGTGIERTRALGRPCRDVLRSAVCAHVGDCPMMQLLASGSESITRQYLVTKNGHEVPFLVSVYPLLDKSGALVGGIETFRRLQPGAAAADNGDTASRRPMAAWSRPAARTRPLEASQRRVIEEVLRQHQWSRAAACRELGLSRATLWRKMRRLGIAPPPS